MAAIPSRLMHRGRTVPRWAVVCAGLSPILLTLAWLAGDLLQPASYSPIRQTISALAGQGATDRWLMTAILFAVGGSYLVTAAGLTGLRLPARILLVIAGICSAGIASSPVLSDGPTALHLAWAALGAVTTAVWPAVAGWRAPPRPKIVSGRGSAIVTVLFVALVVWLGLEALGGNDVGLAERLVSSTQTAWPFVVALLLRRATRHPRIRPIDDISLWSAVLCDRQPPRSPRLARALNPFRRVWSQHGLPAAAPPSEPLRRRPGYGSYGGW